MSRHLSKDSGRHRRPSATRRWLLLAPLAGAVVLAGAVTVACLDANWRFARRAPPPPVRIYSSPFPIREGSVVTPADLAERLARLGYRRVEGRPATPGEYARRFRGLEIALNRYDGPGGPAEPRTVRVRMSSGRISG